MVESTQSGLFESGECPLTAPKKRPRKGRESELSALDEMLRGSGRYRQSGEYLKMLDFLGRFRQYSAFNCLLIYIQDPSVSHVASLRDWEERFGRRPKRKGRPLVILQPFGPVMFLYDLKETEGSPVPEELTHPFKTKGFLPGRVLSNTIRHCSALNIEVRCELEKTKQAGVAIRLDANVRKRFGHLDLLPTSRYLILLNEHHTEEEKYSTLVHELAHIFCGHLGSDRDAWWEDRRGLDEDIVDTEAESVSYLVCRRQGLETASESYLSNYRHAAGKEMPLLVLNTVLHATDTIEKMGEARWKKPS